MLEHISSIVETIVKNETPAEMGVSAGAGTKAHTTVSTHDTSVNDDTTSSGSRQQFITRYLMQGRENAIHAEDLMKLAGFQSNRELRACIEEARAHGDLILSGDNGYFLPSMDADGNVSEQGYYELRAFYNRMRAIGIGTLRSAKYARRSIKEYERAHNEQS